MDTTTRVHQHLNRHSYEHYKVFHKAVNVLASRGDTKCREFLNKEYGITFHNTTSLPPSTIQQIEQRDKEKPTPTLWDLTVPLHPAKEAPRGRATSKPKVKVKYTIKQLKELLSQA